MPILSHPAFGPKTALGYVTGGALMCVWTLVWYFTRGQDRALDHTDWFWLAGLFLTGITFIFLGLVLGPLGRAARQAELPPHGALSAEAAIQQTAAANPAGAGVAPAVQAAPAVAAAQPAQPPVMPMAVPTPAQVVR